MTVTAVQNFKQEKGRGETLRKKRWAKSKRKKAYVSLKKVKVFSLERRRSQNGDCKA